MVPPDTRDHPQLLEEAWAVSVDRQGELARKRTRPAVHAVAVPLDLAVPAGDEWEPLGVDLDPEPIRFRECPEFARRPAAAAIAVSGLHSPAPRRPSYSRAVSQRHASVARRLCTVSQVLCAEGAVVAEIEMIFRARVPRACGVLHRTGANRSSAGFGAVKIKGRAGWPLSARVH